MEGKLTKGPDSRQMPDLRSAEVQNRARIQPSKEIHIQRNTSRQGVPQTKECKSKEGIGSPKMPDLRQTEVENPIRM
jgi:hypothetical protein